MLIAEVLEEVSYTAIEAAEGPAGLKIPSKELIFIRQIKKKSSTSEWL